MSKRVDEIKAAINDTFKDDKSNLTVQFYLELQKVLSLASIADSLEEMVKEKKNKDNEGKT